MTRSSWTLYSAMMVLALGARLARCQEPGIAWAELPAAEFAAAAASLFADESSPPELRATVTQLAWSRFLDDGQFIAAAPWQEVSKLAELFGSKWQLLEGVGPTGDVPELVTTFRTALAARLAQIPVAGTSLAELSATDSAMQLAGLPRGVLAGRAAGWMGSADWRQLTLPEQIELTGLLHAEKVPLERFSVRWTGTLTPSVSGEYVFEQLRQHHVDGVMRLLINEQIVFDSSVDAVADEGQSGRLRVQGRPLALEAGEAVPIRVEYRYDLEAMRNSREFDERLFPMAVLLWRLAEEAPSIIPASTFTAPDGTRGVLSGEYFGDLEFGNQAATRLDPGLQMIWSEKQVVSEFDAEQQEVAQSCAEALLSGDGFSLIDDKARFMERDLPKLLKRLPASQRLAILNELTTRQDWLAAASPFGVRSLFPHLFMLPAEMTADFFTAWVEVREVDVNKILPYPGWGPGSYNAFAYDDYGWVGHFMRGANWIIAERLLEENLEQADGSCNLMVAYCVGMAAVHDARGYDIVDLLNERLEDGELAGDARATWLLARAFMEEVNVGGIPRPLRGIQYLQEGALVAESPQMQYRILQETVARYGSLQVTAKVAQLLEGAEERFPEQAAEIAAWRTQAAP